jgi:uncharacterized protein YjdB
MLGAFCLPASAATSLSKATVTYEVKQTYTGKAIKPSVTVKLGSKKLTKDKSYTVSYSNNKSVGKGTITIKGKGSYTGKVTKNFYIQPKAVSSLKATAYSTKIKLSWKAATGAKGYQVYQVIGKTSKKLPTVSGTSCTITGLDSVTEYTFKVRPYAKVGSKTIFGEFETVKESTTIGKPTTIEFSDITENSAVIKWNKVQGASSYDINYVGGISRNTTSTEEKITLTGLDKGTDYKIKIRAKTKKITGNYSDVFTFTTAPAAVKIKKAELTDEGYVKLSWSAVTGADGYTVYYSKANANATSFKEVGTVTSTSATIKDLTPGTSYIFSVVAFSKSSANTAYSTSTATDAITIPVTKIANFKNTSLNSSSAVFTWSRPSNIDGYKLYKNDELVTTLDTKTTTYTFSDLTAGQSYNFAISAYYKDASDNILEGEKTTLTVKVPADSGSGSGSTVTEVSSVTITSKPTSMKPGDNYTLGTSVLPANASDKTLTYESGNTNVATVSQSGVITAVADGSTTITVKSKSNPEKSDSFTLTVKTSTETIKPTSISLPAQIVMYEGDLLALNPSFTPANVTDKSFTVSGKDYTYSYRPTLSLTSKSDTCEFDDYISISTNGFLKAKKETVQPKGDKKEFSFTVTVTTSNGKTATTQVTVKPRMMTISYNGMEDSPWYYGNSVPLSVAMHSDIDSKYADSDINYKSSNTSVATVTSGGVVNCVGAGEAIITATTKDGKYSTTYEIYIRGVVSLEKSYFEACQTGKTYQIKASILPSDSNDILMFYSLNEDVATVAAGGVVTFHKPGNALIAVTTSSDPYNYKQVWLTSGTYKAPSGSNAQLLSQMKTVANATKQFTDQPNVMIKEKHIFENLKASTTTGTSTDISSLESTIESIFKPTTTFLTAGTSTKDDFIKYIPVRNQSYVIAPSLSESDIQSIKVTDNGEYYYEISMTLKEETHNALPTNPANTRHGKVFEVLTQSLYDDLKAKTGLNPSFDSLTLRYHDCNLTLKVNKITGNLENATYNMITDASVKSLKFTTLIPALNASATYENVITVDFSGYKN